MCTQSLESPYTVYSEGNEELELNKAIILMSQLEL